MSIARNSMYNMAGSIVPLILALATVPLYLNAVGTERYGALAIAWLILGYFGLFDLGLGRATSQRIAALKNSNAEHRARVFWTAVIVNIGMGIFGGIILYFGATYFFEHQFSADDWLKSEILVAIPYLALAVPIATLTGVASGALQGREKFLDVNIITIIGTCLFQLFPLIVAYINGPTLKWLIIAAITARIIGFLIFYVRVHHHILRGFKPNFDRSEWLSLLKFGGWASISSIIGPLILTFDRMMIGAILGPKQVTFYTVPLEIVQRISVIPISIGGALFPRFVTESGEGRASLQDKSLRAVASIASMPTLIVLLILEPFITLWVGREIAENSTIIGLIALLGFWANAFAIIPFSRLQAMGRPDLVTKSLLAQLLPYMAAVYCALMYSGLIAAAIVFSARRLFDFQILYYLSEKKIAIPKYIIIFSIVLAAAFIIAVTMPMTSYLRWIFSALLIFTNALLCVRALPSEIFEFIQTYLVKFKLSFILRPMLRIREIQLSK